MAILKSIQPIIPVKDVLKSAEFFEKILGFKARNISEKYAEVKRDSITLKLIPEGDNVGQLSCYIMVEDIDTLYLELKDKLEELPPKRFRPIFNQAYGMREFHVIDLDSLLIFFGEPIEKI